MIEILGAGAALFDYDGDGDLDSTWCRARMLGPGKTDGRRPVRRAGPLPRPTGSTATTRSPAPTAPCLASPTSPRSPASPPAPAATAWGSPPATTTTTATSTSTSPTSARTSCCATGRRHLRGRHRRGRRRRPALERAGGLLRLRRRRLARPLRRQLRRLPLRPLQDLPRLAGARDYCGPSATNRSCRPAVPQPRRRHLRGRHRSRPASPASTGPALGVVAADLDGDGWIDLYVANDSCRTTCGSTSGDGTFRDEALLRRRRGHRRRAIPRRAWGSTPGTSTATATSTCS
jgi:hypothetical protein